MTEALLSSSYLTSTFLFHLSVVFQRISRHRQGRHNIDLIMFSSQRYLFKKMWHFLTSKVSVHYISKELLATLKDNNLAYSQHWMSDTVISYLLHHLRNQGKPWRDCHTHRHSYRGMLRCSTFHLLCKGKDHFVCIQISCTYKR